MAHLASDAVPAISDPVLPLLSASFREALTLPGALDDERRALAVAARRHTIAEWFIRGRAVCRTGGDAWQNACDRRWPV
jgi:hypothetical protein